MTAIVSGSESDRLDELLNLFPIHAKTSHWGKLCGITDFPAEHGMGKIHLIRRGAATVQHHGHADLHIAEPSVLLYPRPMARRFVTDKEDGAEFVCASLQFDGGAANPIARALPDILVVPLGSFDGGIQAMELLFHENTRSSESRYALVDRLFDIVVAQLLRYLMDTGQVENAYLTGMWNPRLGKALTAMHEDPGREWSLDSLADVAGMSRSIFANKFRRSLGTTPSGYLQAWRIKLAQQALRKGRQLKTIAMEVGYGSEAALSRAFKAQCGMSPREWLAVRTRD